jgi:hypothetical protein
LWEERGATVVTDAVRRAPVVVVLVEPDGAPGVRLVSNLKGGAPAIGQFVRMEVRDGPDGHRPVFVLA